MLKDAVSIQLRGANFANNTILSLLDCSDGKYTKAALLYGRNGSGKSTIANAFRKVSGQESPTIEYASLLDDSNQPIQLLQQEREAISVFSEDFINNNVRIKPDGLDSIVMLGEQVGLSEQIETAALELQAATDALTNANTALAEYRNHSNPKSPEYYSNKIYGVLQQDNGWAGRDWIIKDGKRNSSVTNDTYKSFIHLSPVKSRDELIIAFNDAKNQLDAAKKGSSIINTSVPSMPFSIESFSAERLHQLLITKIERPQLSDREKTLLSLVAENQTDLLKARIGLFEDDSIQFCPYCLQDLSKDHKTHIISVLHLILSEIVVKHQAELNGFLFSKFEPDLSSFSELKSYSSINIAISQLNESIRYNNALIQRKVADPYEPVFDNVVDLCPVYFQVSEALLTLEGEKSKHNAEVSNIQKIKANMQEINNQIAYYDVFELAQKIEAQQTEKRNAENESKTALENYYLKKTQLDDLDAKRKRIDIAVDLINDELKYIFFSEKRLSIQIDNDQLKLLVNGKSVSPSHVSSGECNILALCYFFALLLRGRSKEDAYQVERLIVIDDPISSFDNENRIGILSYLKYKLSLFLSGNNNSRAIIMTHDLLTYYNVEKILSQIQQEWKNDSQQLNAKYNLWELSNSSITRPKYKSRHEYSELLRIIFEYGKGYAEEYDIVIGNIMRQALEAFSSFEYKKGIEDLSTHKEIIGEASAMNDKQRVYFKNLMYRLVLHGGSHRLEQTKSLEVNFPAIISEPEKRRTARDILCFIYLLNKSHLKAHIGDACSEIETWCKSIQ